jgi:methanol dehydrogenase (cytochrome c) subunit 2
MSKISRVAAVLGAAVALSFAGGSAFAYDGTKCKAPGNCWEPVPGFPEKIKGTKYDPKHDPKELAKQGSSEREMEERNAKRTAHFQKTGKWVYDVKKLEQ